MTLSASPAPLPYRPDIDGLRGIAVIGVILFHFSPETLPGGFLGVDVFFVISGFLFTQLLCLPSDRPWMRRVCDFYLRRARRILPALLLTALVVAAAALVLYFPADLIWLGRYLLFAPLLANIASILDGGYFAVDGPFPPLRHYWSLAVEEQFYLLYPLAIPLLFMGGASRRRIVTFAAIVIVSMAICIRGELRHSTSTFYLMPARAWELMFGAVAAVVPGALPVTSIFLEVACYGCLVVIVASLFLFSSSIGFPDLRVVIPCAATAVVLHAGRQRSLTVFRLLSRLPLVFTGKISYSLYLWHAPLLAFAQYYAIGRLTTTELLTLWVALYVVAVLSWQFVEKPFRQRKVLASDRTFVLSALVSCAVVSVLGAWLWTGDGLPGRFSSDLARLTRPDPYPPEVSRCMTLPLSSVAKGDVCRFGPSRPGVKKAFLWGDSHALAVLPAFESLAQANGVQLNFVGRSSCRPVLGGDRFKRRAIQAECEAFNDAVLSGIQRIRPAVTILGGYWGMEAGYEGERPNAAVLAAAAVAQADWEGTLEPLRRAGSEVCVVLDVPELPKVVPYALAMARRRGLDDSFVYVRREDALARYAAFEDPVRALERAGELMVADPKSVLCPGARCELESDGLSLYRDRNHLTRAGAIAIRDSLVKCLR